MAVHIERPEGTLACVVHLSGDLDAAVVPEIRTLVGSDIASGCTYLVLDLEEVTYADSSALGLIVWLDSCLQPIGGKLVLAGADRNVNRVLELSGLVGLAPSVVIAASVRQALRSIDLPPERTEPAWEKHMTVPAQAERMAALRTFICDLVAPLGLEEGALFDLKVAVGEALANAVRHGSPGGAADDVSVTISTYDDRVVVGVRDTGAGFEGDPSARDDVYASGGRGVMFMRALMDRVEFSKCVDGGTLVRLTKRLPVENGAVPRPERA